MKSGNEFLLDKRGFCLYTHVSSELSQLQLFIGHFPFLLLLPFLSFYRARPTVYIPPENPDMETIVGIFVYLL